MTKTILLTGASGQLGAHLRATAEHSGARLLALDSAHLDIRDAGQVENIVQRARPALIINAAAYTQVDQAESEAERAFAVNAQGVRNLAQAAAGQCRIIHVSTDFVFDGSSAAAYRPGDPEKPLSVYGMSKLEGERILARALPASSVIIRTAWLYSATGRNFLTTMLRLMRERDSLSVVSDQRGTPTSVSTLAAAIWGFAAREDLAGLYHWTDAGSASWCEFAREIQRQALELGLLERAIPVHAIPTADYPTPAQRPASSLLDCSATRAALDLPASPWQHELRKTLLEIGTEGIKFDQLARN